MILVRHEGAEVPLCLTKWILNPGEKCGNQQRVNDEAFLKVSIDLQSSLGSFLMEQNNIKCNISAWNAKIILL